MIGTTVSHYRILEKLGEGGMGVVYKAQDMKLDRIVALKFLPHHLISSEAEQARFLQEAKAASALNHPNVCTIHDIKEEKEERFIVMEFVDGVTLRKKFEASPLKVYEAVSYAIQISEALKEAHSRGVVHRDIKSDNVMINSKNQVKVMDFGLAKLKGSLKRTKATSTVGTLGYMAPEQIQGAEADARSDIFSFGVLLFEILTGRLPFRGEHEAAMVYSIVNEEPESLKKYRGDVPNDLQHIILRCLEKDPEDRYQLAEEIVRELHRIQKQSSRTFKTTRAGEVPTTGEIEAAPSPPSIQRIKSSWIILAALVVPVLIGTIVLLVLKKEPAETMDAEVKITKFTSLPGLEDEPTWSPDGKFLAYTADDRGNFDILVQPLGGGQLIRVADSDADDAQPTWSPDGSKLAFVSARDQGGRFSILFGQGLLETYLKGKGGDIFLVPALGGRPVKLVSNGFDPAWSPDGKTIVYRSIHGGRWDLWTVPAEGGTPKQLTSDVAFDYQPSWSPDGKWILYSSGVPQYGYEVRVIPASGGRPMILTNDKTMVVKPSWSSGGKSILFSSNRKGSMNIWKMPFAPDAKEFATPVRITVGEGDDVNIGAASAGSTIAFATVKTSPDIWELTVKSGKLRQVSFETSLEDQPSISPDGKTLIVKSNRGGTDQLWTMDLHGKFLSQLTSDNYVPFPLGSWSPDGKEILYSRSEQGKDQVVVRSLGEISPKKVIDNANFSSWSPDGKNIAFHRVDTVRKKLDVWIHTLETGEEKQLTSIEWTCIFPSWSPDGNWITFNVDKKNTREIWVVASSGGTPRQVLADEAEYSHPIWSPRDKDLILCLRDHKDICLVSVSTGKVKELYKFTESSVNLIDYLTWSPDGQKVYFSLFRKSGDVFVLENY